MPDLEIPFIDQIQRSINAAFDSVNLINELNSLETLTIQEQDRVNRNIQHLQIMLEKSWFTDNLTVEQRQSIDEVVG